MLKNDYGYLTEDHREFIITDPRTPRPWFNYIWNEQYHGLVSHGGGGFSYLESPRDNRISRMRYNTLPWDRPGRYIFLRDMDDGEYWSLSWAPTIEKNYQTYEGHIGQGYTTIVTRYKGIRAELTYFVPRDNNSEIWKVRVRNEGHRKRHLQVFAFQELMMGNAMNDLINQPNDKHFTEVHFNREKQVLEATRRYWVLNTKSASVEQPNFSWHYYVYFTMNLPIKGFDSSLEQFIGKWRSEANPEAVETGQMGNTEITAGDPVVALQSQLSIEPSEERDFAVFMGIAPKGRQSAYDELRIDQYKSNGFVREKLEEVQAHWDHLLSHVKAQTPDESFNAMINVWNQYQTAVTFDMARNAGYYHGGLLFGTGLRDQFQDILGMVIPQPQRVKERILHALRYQFEDGSTLHNFFKLTGHGERTHHSDTPLWIPFGLVEYLNETGDMEILNETVPFYDGAEASVYEHMVRALDFAISDTTERKLPKIRKGDWNDTLDHIGPQGYGETLWGAMFLNYVLDKTFELLDYMNDTDVEERWSQAYQEIARVINSIGWDGRWYVRAFCDNGDVVGSDIKKQGKLFINTQSWAVISGIAPEERANMAIDQCYTNLENKTGMQICWPPYREVEDDIGLISRCVPGKKENGAVFNHASAWFVLASVINGRIEDAWRIYRKMIPFNSSAKVGLDRYDTEPYVYSEYVTSREHETEGQASHSWLTGSSVWMYRIGLDWILGLQTSLKGITVNPHIPAQWDHVEVTRKFRGKTLNISISNPDQVNSGVNQMWVNQQKFSSSWINPADYEDSVLDVQVVLGS